MSTVLVTGASGFVGRHVCSALARAGFSVRVAVRDALPASLVGTVQSCPIGDITAPRDLAAALSGADAIVHLAARVHVMRDAAADPLTEHRRVNTAATLALAEAAAQHGVARFVFMSTVKVNGERTGSAPFTDDDTPAPADPYAVSKHEAEKGLGRIGARTGMQTISLRPPLVYGGGVKGNFLRLMKLVCAGWPLPLASVSNARSMIYVGNLASAVERALRAPLSAAGGFLVSDGADLSTPQLVRALAAALARPARLVPFPPALLKALGAVLGRGDEVGRMIESLQIDSSRFKQQFQWVAPFTVEQGLKETAEWFARRDRLDVPRSVRVLR